MTARYRDRTSEETRRPRDRQILGNWWKTIRRAVQTGLQTRVGYCSRYQTWRMAAGRRWDAPCQSIIKLAIFCRQLHHGREISAGLLQTKTLAFFADSWIVQTHPTFFSASILLSVLFLTHTHIYLVTHSPFLPLWVYGCLSACMFKIDEQQSWMFKLFVR